MKGKALLILLAAAFVICSCSKSRPEKYMVQRLRDGAMISFSQMIGELKGTDFVFVGERHDSMENHQIQLRVIKDLHAGGAPLAVGFEMFWARSQPQLDQWLAGKISDEDFIRLYYRDWRLPWPYYRDIFLYLKKEGIAMVGLNVPREVSQKVAGQGAASLSKEELGELPPGLSCDVRPEYKEYIRQVFSVHAKNKGESFQNFCEAQVLWDKVMAWHLVEHRKKHPAPTVVLCGLVHALRRGIPSRVEEMQKNASIKIIIPQSPGVNLGSNPSRLADYLILKN